MTERRDNSETPQDIRRRLRPVRRFLWSLAILLAAADVVHHRHTILRIEEFPAFYGLFSLIACTVLVLGAKALRTLVRRREDYYDG